MAFEEFGQLSKRRRAEDAEKLKKRIVIIIIAFVLVFLSVGGGILAYIHYTNQNESNGYTGSGKPRGSSSDKMVKELCRPTDYKVKCEDTVAKVVKSGTLQPAQVVMASISAASNEFTQASKQIMSTFKFDTPNDKVAYDDCKMLFEDALEELQVALSKSEQFCSRLVDDLRTWLSAVVSYQETCVDGFSDQSEMKTKMKAALNASKAYLSNSLAIVANMPALISKYQKGRRLLLAKDNYDQDHVNPHWVGRMERELMEKSTDKLVPNVTVSKDGSGNFTTINEALAALPKARQGRYDPSN